MEIIKDESQFRMQDWWKKVFVQNFANFEGRARRSEYWYYILFNLIISVSVYVLTIFTMGIAGFILLPLLGLYSLANIIPNLAVIVRRLHDTGKSGWYILFAFIPLVGGIILIVFLATEGDRGPNEYGPDPKEQNAAINQIGRS